MSRKQLGRYRFKSEAQWSACLFSQADCEALRSGGGFRPFRPYADEPTRYESQGARAPVALRTGEILWCDDTGMLHRSAIDNVTNAVIPAPPSIARASRVVSLPGSLWVRSAGGDSLECYDDETLTHLITVDLQPAHIVDIAGGDRGTLYVLVEQGDELQCIRVSNSGRELDAVSIGSISQPRAFTYLRRSQQFVVLAGDLQPRLYWFARAGGEALCSRPVAATQPCFKPDHLGSDSAEKIVLAGSTGGDKAPHYAVFALDADGSHVGEVMLEVQATGIAATREHLIVADARGVLRYVTTDIVPDTTAEVQCTLITPLLQSTHQEGGFPWLRVDVSTILPEGTTLAISYAAPDTSEGRARMQGTADDARLPPGLRIQKLLSEPGVWSSKTVFHGSEGQSARPNALRSAPLFSVRERQLWVCVTLTAGRGARLPAVTELAVVYPGRSLVESLPTPYRRAAEQPHDFLRSLVGVLEATTQDLDARIAALGSHIHPATAAGPWMDYIARWLGLPWDDALADDQKRAILHRAPELARGRGTRAGLETLLECLLPGTPRRFRVTDPIVDFGYAVVGGDRCAGSALPALLGGFTRWHAELDATTVLGYTRLSCLEGASSVQRTAAKLRVEVAAGHTERAALEPWLLTLITEMVPLTLSVDLHWVSAQALRTNRLDETLVLEPPPRPELGSDIVTDLARLPEQRRSRLSGSGPALGTRLR